MEGAITKGVKISVEVGYQHQHSEQSVDYNVFAYRITIENQNPFTVQLMRRHWYIVDGDGTKREVEGAGVVGECPILAPKASHQYVSGCHLTSAIGKMYGTYLMRVIDTEETFYVDIPEFIMIVPFILN